MANFPMIPMNWDFENVTLYLHNGSRLAVNNDGSMALEGSVKDAALAIVKFVVQRELSDGAHSVTLNHALHVERIGKLYKIDYLGSKDKKPEFWDQLSREFDKIIKMKAFW